MKKIMPILLLLIVFLAAWLYLTKQAPQQQQTPEPTNAVVEPPPSKPETSLVELSSNAIPIEAVQQPTNTIEPTAQLTNALTATNLAQWTNAIKGLKPLAGFKFQQHWLVEQPMRTNGIPIVLSLGNKTIQYSAVLVSILAKNGTGDIMEVEMQTPNMNIDETRELGLQLCNMLGIDPKGFLAWCDQVGNRWMDQPLFGDGDGHHYSFHLLQTFNNEKPWSINFMIIPNP
jgi:hypothetical protein